VASGFSRKADAGLDFPPTAGFAVLPELREPLPLNMPESRDVDRAPVRSTCQ